MDLKSLNTSQWTLWPLWWGSTWDWPSPRGPSWTRDSERSRSPWSNVISKATNTFKLCSVALKASEICEHKKLCWDVEWRHPNYDIWQTSSSMKTNSKVSRMRSMNSIMNERLDGNCHWDWKSRPQGKILSQWWPSTRDLTNLSMYLPWSWRLLCIEVRKCNSEIEIKIFMVNMIFQALFHDKITVMAEWQQRQELLMTG